MDIKKAESFYWVDWMVEERERQGMSQADLAQKTGLTRTTISDYERRERATPDVRALVKISKALGHSPLKLPRLAGLLPPETELDDESEDIIEAVADLTKREKQELLAYINFQKNQRKRK